MASTGSAAVMKARIRISPPQPAPLRGKISWTRARRRAQREGAAARCVESGRSVASAPLAVAASRGRRLRGCPRRRALRRRRCGDWVTSWKVMLVSSPSERRRRGRQRGSGSGIEHRSRLRLRVSRRPLGLAPLDPDRAPGPCPPASSSRRGERPCFRSGAKVPGSTDPSAPMTWSCRRRRTATAISGALVSAARNRRRRGSAADGSRSATLRPEPEAVMMTT
jgi:hypothetical protein